MIVSAVVVVSVSVTSLLTATVVMAGARTCVAVPGIVSLHHWVNVRLVGVMTTQRIVEATRPVICEICGLRGHIVAGSVRASAPIVISEACVHGPVGSS